LGSASVSLFLLSPLGDELDQTYPLEAATKSSTGLSECGEIHLKCSLLKMEMSNVQLAKCRQAFEAFDADGSGAVDSDELGGVLRGLGYTPTDDEVMAMVRRVDADGSGEIEFNEFLPLMEDIGDKTISEVIEEAAAKLAFNLASVSAKYESKGAAVRSHKKRDFTISGRVSAAAEDKGAKKEDLETMVSHLERNLGKAFLVLTDKHEQYLKTAAVEDNKGRHQDAKALEYMKGVVDCLAQATINLSTIINAADPSVKVMGPPVAPDTVDEGAGTAKYQAGKLTGLWSKFVECLKVKRSEGALEDWLGDGNSLAEVDEFLTDAVGTYDDLYKFLNESRFSSGMSTAMMALRMKNKLKKKKSFKIPSPPKLSVTTTKVASATGHHVTTVVTEA